jgi:HSP20 family protein
MLGLTRLSRVDDVFNVQREMDRIFNQFWSELPKQSAPQSSSMSFHVNATDDGWRIDVPLPGVDPKNVQLEVAGNTLSIRTTPSTDEKDEYVPRYEQTFTIPQFLDLEKMSASHRHGMLRLTLPLKESVKPRRIQIETQDDQQSLLQR